MKLAYPLFLIAVGGVANIIDRIRFGYVRDPLLIGSLYFNGADICIAIGIILSLYVLYRNK